MYRYHDDGCVSIRPLTPEEIVKALSNNTKRVKKEMVERIKKARKVSKYADDELSFNMGIDQAIDKMKEIWVQIEIKDHHAPRKYEFVVNSKKELIKKIKKLK